MFIVQENELAHFVHTITSDTTESAVRCDVNVEWILPRGFRTQMTKFASSKLTFTSKYDEAICSETKPKLLVCLHGII